MLGWHDGYHVASQGCRPHELRSRSPMPLALESGMVNRRVLGFVIVTLAAAALGCNDIDARTESARKRILALDATEATRIVAFCKSWTQEGGLLVDQFPSALPVSPTSRVHADLLGPRDSRREADRSRPLVSRRADDR
jgi:hypothetical protein